jgi:hypothetical protein
VFDTDGGRIEIWHPHASHSDAFVLVMLTFERSNLRSFGWHISCRLEAAFRAQWVLEEIRDGMNMFVSEDPESNGIDIDFRGFLFSGGD